MDPTLPIINGTKRSHSPDPHHPKKRIKIRTAYEWYNMGNQDQYPTWVQHESMYIQFLCEQLLIPDVNMREMDTG